ncbi:serine/threonine protein kinase [Dactylosporangium sp. NBC_01737]|uniref:serine/threonine-protein kinase n=1 Tax=Dactylosporangium sp. NBC_01737 TaxID=2975959 RepID=UPI002E0E3EFF|nr:serine/threonine protein kinase [Dactylosporangium sp. NBC_01737]
MQQEQILGGRYRLTGQLGVGGMAVVWKAHDELLNRHVAVKVLAGRQAESAAARRRVQAEAQAAAQLWHPNVTNVYDYGEAPDEAGRCVPYVVMELLPGRTLSQRLAAGPLPPQAALRICAEVADALAAAHDRHVVHRDVKPANVMLTPSGAKVLDFGLAAVAGQPDLDEEGQLLGTAAYLAPERLTGDEVLPASDVYALGLLIHRALTDELPWEADTPSQMLNAHVYVEPDPLPPIDGVPAAVNEICDRCLMKEPADRPSAAEVAAVLTAAAGIVPRPSDDLPAPAGDPSAPAAAATAAVTTPATKAPQPAPRRIAVLVGAAVAGAVVAAVALSQTGTGPREREHSTAGAARNPTAAPGPSGDPTSTPQAAGSSAATPTGSAAVVALPETSAARPPTTTPTPEATTPPTPEPGVQISAYGGTARVSCTGKKAQILSLDIADGYTLGEYRPGPADEVKAVLMSSTNTSEIKAKCSKGAPVPIVKETPPKP